MDSSKSSKNASKVITQVGDLNCPTCQHDRFFYRESQLNTRLATLLNIDFVDKKAHCYICEKCSNIQWFLDKLPSDD